MSTRRKTIFALLLAVLLCSGSAAGAAGEGVPVTIVQYGKERFLLYLPLYIAMEEGLFAKRGLNVSLKFGGTPDQVFAAVISGEAQFGVADPVFTAISHDKGGPGKVVAMLLMRLGMSGVTNNDKIRPIMAVANLNGLRIGSFPEPSTAYTLLSEIKRTNGLDFSIVQAPIGGQVALLDAGKADIALDFEPNVSLLEDKGYKIVFDLAAITAPRAITGVTTTEDFIKDHPEIVQKIVDALQEAMALMYESPAIARQVAQKIYSSMPDRVIKAAVDRMLKDDMYPHSVIVQDKLWQRTLKTRLDSGELTKPQATDVAVDNRFARRAAKNLGVSKQ